ncbi:MAG: N-glycosylase/DNA lyase [Candidatus Omnitrophica bacterium]|nr:N-glycosylase/DNA lyase [Candidatus Omnitrophota bacterium]
MSPVLSSQIVAIHGKGGVTSRIDSLKKLVLAYKKIRPQIKKRLAEFSLLHKDKDEKIFSELSFCILTANANAARCNEAIQELEARGLLLKGRPRDIRPHLKGRARFHNKKADYIVGARNIFRRGKSIDIKSRLDKKDVLATREWLVNNIKGFGYKEASHFLRNIGLGQNMAILDRHILKNLKRYGVIDKVPDSLGSRKVYLDIEDKMRLFSRKSRIPLEELDLLFWSLETVFVFK